MSNLWKKYETDQKKEHDGVDVEIDGVTFICRRAGGANRAYRAAIGMTIVDPKLQERLQSKDPGVAMEAENEVTMQAFADSVVVGWRGMLDRNDQPLEFSREALLDLLNSCPDVWDRLRIAAADRDNFRLNQVKEIGEALGNSSAGEEGTERT